MDASKRLWQRVEERQRLWSEVPNVFPIRRDLAKLKARHEAGDPNVVVRQSEDGHPEHYAVEFTQGQREELKRRFRDVKPAANPLDHDDDLFVRLIESQADMILDAQAIYLPDQKSRGRAIDSFVSATQKLDTALDQLDSAALGWLYGHIADRLAPEGYLLSEADGRVASMRNDPLRAQVEAGRLRQEIRHLVGAVTEAAAAAKKSLPAAERTEHDPRLRTALCLERQIVERGIPFVTTETGFPAACLRAMFEIAGVEVEKVGYWLDKAARHPDSFGLSLAERRKKFGGKNPPAD